MIYILKIRNAIPTIGYESLYATKEPPYYFKDNIGFWLICNVVDLATLKKDVMHRLLNGLCPEEEFRAIKATSYDCVLAAEVFSGGSCGDLEVCQDSDNFDRVIPKGSMTDLELGKEFSDNYRRRQK